MNKDFVLSYSGGKDSIFALHKMIERGYTPKALFTIMRHNNAGSNCHRLSKEMLSSASDAIGIPIHFLDLQCNIAYDRQLENFIKTFKDQGIDHCVFGDINLELVKKRSQDICDNLKMNAIFPLWQINEEEYLKEFINLGYKSLIKSILPRFPDQMLGRIFDMPFIEEIKTFDANICGENGEYHTFVFDGPIFKHSVSYRLGEQLAVPPYKTIELFKK